VNNARILRQSAILIASDLPKSIAYWQDRLGFDKHGIFGEPPAFAIMEYGNAFVMLRQAPEGHSIVPNWQVNEGLWNAYFWVDDVKAMFEDMTRRGATVDYGLCDQFYGVREFAVHDPDKQSIGFGQLLTPAANGKPA
jgi:catechol 2,3-dioxygenase-like lactoylglutathione lyase family enzyme